MADAGSLRVQGSGERWRITGGSRAADRQLCNDYLGYLADRRYSPASVRAYAFDLLHFAGVNLRAAPYADRRRYLAQCLLPGPLVHLVHAEQDGIKLHAAALASGFEGVGGLLISHMQPKSGGV